MVGQPAGLSSPKTRPVQQSSQPAALSSLKTLSAQQSGGSSLTELVPSGRLSPRSGRSSGRSSPFNEREDEVQAELEEKRKQRSEAAIQWVDKEIKKVSGVSQ